MFNRTTNTNNTTKKGIRAFAERALVLMLSFMMAIQVIPFSMYGIEGTVSNAASTNLFYFDKTNNIYVFDMNNYSGQKTIEGGNFPIPRALSLINKEAPIPYINEESEYLPLVDYRNELKFSIKYVAGNIDVPGDQWISFMIEKGATPMLPIAITQVVAGFFIDSGSNIGKAEESLIGLPASYHDILASYVTYCQGLEMFTTDGPRNNSMIPINPEFFDENGYLSKTAINSNAKMNDEKEFYYAVADLFDVKLNYNNSSIDITRKNLEVDRAILECSEITLNDLSNEETNFSFGFDLGIPAPGIPSPIISFRQMPIAKIDKFHYLEGQTPGMFANMPDKNLVLITKGTASVACKVIEPAEMYATGASSRSSFEESVMENTELEQQEIIDTILHDAAGARYANAAASGKFPLGKRDKTKVLGESESFYPITDFTGQTGATELTAFSDFHSLSGLGLDIIAQEKYRALLQQDASMGMTAAYRDLASEYNNLDEDEVNGLFARADTVYSRNVAFLYTTPIAIAAQDGYLYDNEQCRSNTSTYFKEVRSIGAATKSDTPAYVIVSDKMAQGDKAFAPYVGSGGVNREFCRAPITIDPQAYEGFGLDFYQQDDNHRIKSGKEITPNMVYCNTMDFYREVVDKGSLSEWQNKFIPYTMYMPFGYSTAKSELYLKQVGAPENLLNYKSTTAYNDGNGELILSGVFAKGYHVANVEFYYNDPTFSDNSKKLFYIAGTPEEYSQVTPYEQNDNYIRIRPDAVENFGQFTKTISSWNGLNGEQINALINFQTDGDLYAKLNYEKNSISFSNQNPHVTYSTSSQTVSISEPTEDGPYDSSKFTYAKNGTWTNNNFSLNSSTGKITVPANTAPGDYTCGVKVTDTSTSATATATITVTVDRMSPNLSLTSNSLTLTYGTNDSSITATRSGSGALSVSTSNGNVASATISNGKITVTPKACAADNQTCTITVSVAQNGNYAAQSKTISVTVNRANTMTATVGTSTFEYDKNAHSITLKSNVASAKVDYGTSTSYGKSLTLSSTANTLSTLSGVSRTDLSTSSSKTTVYYKVTKAGYKDVTGSIELKIQDTTAPTVTLGTITNSVSATKTVPFTLSDTQGIQKYYWGTSPTGSPNTTSAATSLNLTANASGTWYFIAQDPSENESTAVTVKFYETTLSVTNGTVKVDGAAGTSKTVLTQDGKNFNLPAITASTGYSVPTTNIWKVGTAAASIKDQGSYTPAADATLSASTTANTITLTGDDNISITTSTSAQTAKTITKPSEGTGTYKYSITSQKITGGSAVSGYFSLSSGTNAVDTNPNLTAKANIPAGTYEVVVTATDNKSTKTASATFKITVSRRDGTGTLNTNELSLTYPTAGTVTLSNAHTFSGVTAVPADDSVATASVSTDGKTITITPKAITDETKSTTVTVTVPQTTTQGAVTLDIAVTVNQGTMTVTPVTTTFEYDGSAKSVIMKADKANATAKYSKDSSYSLTTSMDTASTNTAWSSIQRTDVGSDTINYKVSAPGYKTVTGTVTLTIKDETAPTDVSITSTNNVANSQTVTLKAKDAQGITSYYWGKGAVLGDSGEGWHTVTSTTDMTETLTVDAEGTYYFIPKDKSGNTPSGTPASMTFYKTNFKVTNGTPADQDVITQSGQKFTLPSITPTTGYNGTATWTDGTNNYTAGTEYTVNADKNLTAECSEKTATLTYHNMGHGTEPAAVTMKYTEETILAAALEETGWIFQGWNTASDGKSGTTYQAGTQYKPANTDPTTNYATDLYAMWIPAELTFANQDKTISTSSEVQKIEITAATGGSTNPYEYTITSQTGGGNFTIEAVTEGENAGKSYIVIPANTVAGTYTVNLHAYDEATTAESKTGGVYTITINRRDGELVLSSTDDIDLYYPTAGELTITKASCGLGNVTYSVDPAGVVDVTYDSSTGKFTLTPRQIDSETATATLTINAVQTDTQNVKTETIGITVHQGVFEITPIGYEDDVDGSPHFAQIKSDLEGVTIVYGTDTNYDKGTILVQEANKVYDMSNVTNAEDGTVTVYYKATLPGYTTVTGTVNITLTDDTKPETSYECTNNVAPKQTVTLKASDASKIHKFYWGTNEDPNPEGGKYTTLDNDVATFERTVEVTEAGTYYFYAIDKKGLRSEEIKLVFHKTEFEAAPSNFGTVQLPLVLTLDGNKFEMPTYTANYGVVTPETWSNDQITGLKPGDEYTPTGDAKFVAAFQEGAGILTYVTAHGVAPASIVMKTSDEVRAAAVPVNEDGSPVKGYTFEKWTSNEDGTGDSFLAGTGVVKNAEDKRGDITLYAQWIVNDLTFNNTNINFNCSLENQTFDITPAENGTDNYTYTLADIEHFSLDGETVTIDANTPAGDYGLQITATDDESGATKTATYTVRLSKIAGELELSSYSETLQYPATATVNVTKNTAGNITVQSLNPSIAEASIDDGVITLQSGTTAGGVKVTVTAAATGCCESVSKEIEIIVSAGTFTITNVTPATFQLGDGPDRSATIKASIDGVEVRYGLNDDKSNTKTVGTTDTVLDNVKVNAAGTYTIGYSASKAGYETVTGTITFEIIDTEGPAITLEVGNELTTSQTVTITVKDLSKVEKIYWGSVDSPTYTNVENGGQVELEMSETVEEEGTYFFYAKDAKNNESHASVQIVKTSFNVTHGSVTPAYTFNLKGSKFNLPEIVPAEGYDAPDAWNDGTEDGAEYEATTTKEFTADCIEKTATLTYSTPRGTLASETVQMKYTTTTNAVNIDNIQGWTFAGWNDQADFRGKTYASGEAIHTANSLTNLENMTLYAVWTANPLTFPEPTEAFEFTGSEEVQYVDINDATGGTVAGVEYSIASQPNGNYFSVPEGQQKIAISTSTPMGSFTVKVKAEDKDSHAVAYANYQIVMTKQAGNIELDKYEVPMTFPTAAELNITAKTGNNITITSDNKNLLDITKEGDKITLTPKDTGTTTLTVKVAATGMYSEASKTVDVTVNPGTFTLTATGVNTVVDGNPHYAYIRSNDVTGIRVEYGETEDCEDGFIKSLGTTDVPMSNVSRTDKSETTVHYVATKKGYNDVTGTVDIILRDETDPVASIPADSITNKLQDNQTIKLCASDDAQIVAYYFGKEAVAENREFTNLQVGVKEFELLYPVTEAGTYYFVAKDKSGDLSNVVELDFYQTTFTVTNGKTNLATVLTAAGKTITLPAVTPNNGYNAATQWVVSGTEDSVGAPEATYAPEDSLDLVADCPQIVLDPVNVSFENITVAADGQLHAPLVKSEQDGVKIEYGTSGDSYEYTAIIETGATGIELDKVAEISCKNKTIYYKASKDGFTSTEGSFQFNVTDSTDPVVEIKDITHTATTTQTVTLSATDECGITGWFFGKNSDATELKLSGNFENFSDSRWNNIQSTTNFEQVKVQIPEFEGSISSHNLTFLVHDNAGNMKTASVIFYKIPISVTNGTASTQYMMVQSGVENETPTITPNPGYNLPEKWSYRLAIMTYNVNYGDGFTATSSYTLSATCPAKKGRITYDANGFGTAPQAVQTNYATAYNAASALADSEGMRFVRWNTQANGKGISYDPGDPIKAENSDPTDITLYAIWEEISQGGGTVEEEFTVSFDGDVEGTIDVAADGQSHAPTIKADTDDVTVIYGFESGKLEYTATIASGNAGVELSKAAMVAGSKTIWYKAMKSGYKTIEESYITFNVNDAVDPSDLSVVFDTHRAALTQEVTLSAYDAGGITKFYLGTVDDPEDLFDSDWTTLDVPVTNFERSGVETVPGDANYFYVMDAAGNITSYEDGITLYKWTFEVKGGTVAQDTIWVYNEEGVANALPAITPNPGYASPESWFVTYTAKGKEKELGDTESIDSFIPTGDGLKYDLVFSADCVEVEKTISFNANGVDATMPEDKVVKLSDEVKLAAPTNIPDGTEFVAWCLTEDGLSQRYPENSVIKTSGEEPQDIELFAIWRTAGEGPAEESVFTLSFDGLSVEANGALHAPTIKASTDDVTIFYGTESGKLKYTTTAGLEGAELSEVALRAGTETIYYKASKKGFKDIEERSVEFSVSDSVKPSDLGVVFVTHTATATQKVTLSAHDAGGVAAFYFGLESNPTNVTTWTTLDVSVVDFERTDISTVPGEKNYFHVKDITGNVSTFAVDFCEWTFEIEGGSVAVESVWVEKAASNNALPVITPNAGYGMPSMWSIFTYRASTTEWKSINLDTPLDGYTPNEEDSTLKNLLFKATCPEIVKTITFNANGETATMPANITVKLADLVNAPEPTTVPEGKEFVCWSLTANGNGQRYQTNAVVKAANTEPQDITLYAIWKDAGSPGEPEVQTIEMEFTNSITIGSDLSVNYYPGKDVDAKNLGGTMKFIVGPKHKEQVAEPTTDGNGRPCYKCKLTINQIYDDITWEYTFGNKQASSTDTYKLFDYLDKATNATNAAKYPSLAACCNDLKMYGYHAQQYLADLNELTLGPTGDYAKVPSYADPTAAIPESYDKLTCTTTNEFIDKENIARSLVLMTNIQMNLFIPLKSGHEWTNIGKLPTIKVNNGSETVTLTADDIELKSSELVVTVKGIPYSWVDKDYTITIGDDTTIVTSPIAYLYKLSENGSSLAQRFAKSMYEFWQSLKAY